MTTVRGCANDGMNMDAAAGTMHGRSGHRQDDEAAWTVYIHLFQKCLTAPEQTDITTQYSTNPHHSSKFPSCYQQLAGSILWETSAFFFRPIMWSGVIEWVMRPSSLGLCARTCILALIFLLESAHDIIHTWMSGSRPASPSLMTPRGDSFAWISVALRSKTPWPGAKEGSSRIATRGPARPKFRCGTGRLSV